MNKKAIKILIAEDESIIAMDMKITLNHLGYSVAGVVDSGDDILSFVKNNTTDIILMDVRLKGEMSGIDAAKNLYKEGYTIPVIYTSSEITNDRLNNIRIPITHGFLMKPLREDALYSAIEIALEKSRLTKEIQNKNTELAQINKELEEVNEQLIFSEKKYRSLFENANDAVFIAEADTGILLDANNKAYTLTGLTPKELIGMHQHDLHPTYQYEVSKETFFSEDHQQGNSAYSEFEVLHKDGHTTPVEINSSVIKIDGKKFIIGMFRDISYRKKKAEEIAKAEQKFYAVFNHSIYPQILWKLIDNNQLIIEDINNAYMKRLNEYGYKLSKNELIGLSLQQAGKVLEIDDITMKKTIEYYRQALSEKKVVKYIENTNLKEKPFYTEISLVPILNEKEECVYILFNSHSISDYINKFED